MLLRVRLRRLHAGLGSGVDVATALLHALPKLRELHAGLGNGEPVDGA